MRTRRIAHLLGTSLVMAMVSGCGEDPGAGTPPGAPVPAPPAEGGKMFQKPGSVPKGKTGATHSSPNMLRGPFGSSHA
jgi:hypothetical protein